MTTICGLDALNEHIATHTEGVVALYMWGYRFNLTYAGQGTIQFKADGWGGFQSGFLAPNDLRLSYGDDPYLLSIPGIRKSDIWANMGKLAGGGALINRQPCYVEESEEAAGIWVLKTLGESVNTFDLDNFGAPKTLHRVEYYAVFTHGGIGGIFTVPGTDFRVAVVDVAKPIFSYYRE